MNRAGSPLSLLDALGDAPLDGELALDEGLHGFGGLHGGLALGMLVRRLCEKGEHPRLHGVQAQFMGALRGPVRLQAEVTRSGRNVSWCSGAIFDRGEERARVTATATFGADDPRPPDTAHQAPMPCVPPAEDCAAFGPPGAFVPFAQHLLIRPAGPARPYAGGSDPTLVAWLSLRDGGSLNSPARLCFLLDALAPAHSAVLAQLVPIPTLTFGVTFAAPMAALAETDTLLLRSTTSTVAGAGFLEERIDAWSPEGMHVASAQQLRYQLPVPQQVAS